ncbi:MAG TPA: hypothetical protein VKQ05_01875 [Gemmatimonadales bacterium]|nr:hypothetical protein [Gemmatimonadales bacterium]
MGVVTAAFGITLALSLFVLAAVVHRVYELEDQVDELEHENEKLRGWKPK